MGADLLKLQYLRTVSCLDNSDHYRVIAEGSVNPLSCTSCGHDDFYKHGSQNQTYVDTPMHGKRVLIEIDRRRFRCKVCGKTIFEALPDMDGKRQATSRLIQYIERRCLKDTFSALSREIGIDDKTVRFIFDDYVIKCQNKVQYKTPEIMGIDGLKIIGDYRAILTNIGKLALFDLLPSRKKVSLLEYFDALSDKQNVTTLVMDMWNPYRQVGRKLFPGRLIVADRFHVIRMANDGMERVRKQIRKTVDDKTRIKLKDEHFLLYKRKANLTDEDTEKVQKWFNMFPQLQLAYEAKESFHDVYCQPTREAGELKAGKWASNIRSCIEKHFRDLRVALHSWHEEIFNYYENPVTNGYAESMNNINRFINRMGRGYSFEVLRARLLYDEKVIKVEKSASCNKISKPEPLENYGTFSHGQTIATSNDDFEYVTEEGLEVNYGADLSTLARLLEDGYFS